MWKYYVKHFDMPQAIIRLHLMRLFFYRIICIVSGHCHGVIVIFLCSGGLFLDDVMINWLVENLLDRIIFQRSGFVFFIERT